MITTISCVMASILIIALIKYRGVLIHKKRPIRLAFQWSAVAFYAVFAIFYFGSVKVESFDRISIAIICILGLIAGLTRAASAAIEYDRAEGRLTQSYSILTMALLVLLLLTRPIAALAQTFASGELNDHTVTAFMIAFAACVLIGDRVGITLKALQLRRQLGLEM